MVRDETGKQGLGRAARDLRSRWPQRIVLAVTLLMILTQIGGFLYTRAEDAALNRLRTENRHVRIVQQTLVDTQSALENYALTGETSYLREHLAGFDTLDGLRAGAAVALDPIMAKNNRRARERSVAAFAAKLVPFWQTSAKLTSLGRREEARAVLFSADARRLLDDLRGVIRQYLAQRDVDIAAMQARIAFSERIVLALQLLGGAIAMAGLVAAFRIAEGEARRRRGAIEQALSDREKVELLFQMADTLQSAVGYADANAVLEATCERLLPGFGGALYIFNNSRDRLDLSTAWNCDEDDRPPESVLPAQCWALKRGKRHVNVREPGALICAHHDRRVPVLEIPMMARGEVHGLLEVFASGDDAVERLKGTEELAVALADGMSLALSNIALREKLRNQALRDSLTGLYNRRYMEDMLDRFALLAQRNKSALSVVMIDLDHFKRLNDEHGHAKGDAVLRDAAVAIAGGLRQTDVACRYGGEELLLLLPDCDLDDALARAEVIRARVEGLSEWHGTRITASFGVASMPETANQRAELIALADAALYRAKRAGRNQVMAAARRPETAEERLELKAAE